MKKILIIDDDAEVQSIIRTYLEREGFSVLCASSSEEGRTLFDSRYPDLVILDIFLPDGNGLDVCNYLRGISKNPIILISAKGDESDKVLGLGLGADDFVTKPFSMNELVARVKAQIRRNDYLAASVNDTKMAESTLLAGPFIINTESRTVLYYDKELTLTAKEFDLLVFFIQNENRVFNRCYGTYSGRPCYKVMHNRDEPCPDCKTFIVFETGKPQNWISYNWRGTIYHVYDYPFVDENGELLVLEMGIDVTEQQKYEDMRLELFANISHELRSPLAKIVGYTEALRDNIYQGTEANKKLVECIYVNAFSLNKLISDLFELSKLETTQRAQLEPVNLYRVLLDFCEEQELYFDSKELKFVHHIEQNLPTVMADTNRIIQVLVNITENASRFTEPGGTISLSAYRAGKSLCLSVADTGKGIAPDDVRHVFARFYQGARKCKSKNHSGLGLNICQTIIEQHNGRIWVDSEEGKGSVFYIRIPECDT